MMFDRLSKLALRERIGLAIALFFVLALIVEKLVVQSLVDKFRMWNEEIVATEVNVAINRQILESKDEVARQYEGMGNVFRKVSSKDEAIADMKGEIDDLARRTGISLQSMEHKEPVKAEMGYGEEYSVVVGSFEADTTNLLTFVYELQKLPGMLRLNRLTVGPGKNAGAVKGAMTITKIMIPAEG